MEIADMTTTLHELTSCEQDAVLLGRIAGSAYHEVSYILRTDPNGNHQIVGRASDWPLIQLRAENAEQAALLIAATQQAEQADALALTLRAQLDAAEARERALRAELDQAALIPPRMAAAATGLVVEPFVMCPEAGCGKQFKNAQAIIMHRQRAHGYRAAADAPTQESDASTWLCATCGKPGTPSVNEPQRCKRCVRNVALMDTAPAWTCATCGRERIPSIGDPTRCTSCVRDSLPTTHEVSPWRCANTACSGAFAQSMKNESYCTECAKTQPIGSTNGHAREVGVPL